MTLLVAIAAAAPAGFVVQGEQAGCTLALGPDEADGVVPMWASCEWPDVEPAAVISALSSPQRYGRIWPNVLASRVVGEHDGALQVWQKHDLPAFADREVVVDWHATAIPGGRRFSWVTADVEWELQPGDERCVHYEARWDVTLRPGGGVRLVHETRYASGTLPPWLIRPFLGRELASAVEALRDYVTAQGA